MKNMLVICRTLAVAAFGFLILQGLACEDIDEPGEVGVGNGRGIVKGEPTNYEQFQGVIGLYSGMSMCTGTLIAPDVILSAGHCVRLLNPGQGLPEVNYVDSPEQLVVIGGAAPVNGEEVYYGIAERVIAHPNWKGRLGSSAVDLSMIKLSNPVEGIQVYGVRSGPAPARGDKGKIVGYGLLSSMNQMSAGIHRMGDTTVKSVNSRVLELGNPTGTCQGDSGGPFLTDEDGKWVVSGVTSFGMSSVCSATGGGYDVNVATYRKWIEETFRELTGMELSEVDTSAPGSGGGSEDDVPDDPGEDVGEDTSGGGDVEVPGDIEDGDNSATETDGDSVDAVDDSGAVTDDSVDAVDDSGAVSNELGSSGSCSVSSGVLSLSLVRAIFSLI